MREFRWASGPPEPTRDERESAQEWLEHDASKRLASETENRKGLRLCVAHSIKLLRAGDETMESEIKFWRGELAKCEAAIQSAQNTLGES